MRPTLSVQDLQDPLIPALRQWRRQNRMKQSAAGDLLGVSQATISRWESGQGVMSPGQRRRLRDLLGRPASRSQALARHLVTRAPGLAGLVDRDLVCLAASAEAAREHGVPQSMLEGLDFRPLLPPRTLEVMDRLAAHGFFDGAVASARAVFHVPLLNGRQRLADHLAIPYRDEDGAVLMLLTSTVLPSTEDGRAGELEITMLAEL